MKKSKKILVTSLATATLGLIALSDTTGDFPFSAQHVSAQEKDASKNGKVVKENTTSASNQAEKSKTPAQNPAEKPKTPAQKPAEKPKTPAPKPAEKAKETTPKQDKSQSKVQSGWVGNYYLKSDGKRAKNEWVDGGRYYVDSDGKMVKSDWIYDKNYDSYYYLTAEGSSARNKWVGKYYLKSDGKMAKNEWVDGGRYYVDSDGYMVTNKWVDGGRYYVGYDGVRQPKPADGNPYNAALSKAKSYNSSLHMSKKALYDQLTWHGFSSSAVQYAIDHLNADYKANALIRAREYRKKTNLSKTKIYERLTSPWNGQFTKEEANYAIQKLGDK